VLRKINTQDLHFFFSILGDFAVGKLLLMLIIINVKLFLGHQKVFISIVNSDYANAVCIRSRKTKKFQKNQEKFLDFSYACM